MKKVISLGCISIAICSMLWIILVVSCSKNNDSSEEENPCEMIKATYNGISITYPNSNCSGESGTTSFNEYGQPISFTFYLTCGGSYYSFNVYNIAYNGVGDVQSYDATINGTNCHWEK
jgi:hypothetical protein